MINYSIICENYYIIITVNAITMCVDVLHRRFLASWLICNHSPCSGLSKKDNPNIFFKRTTYWEECSHAADIKINITQIHGLIT